MGKIEIGQIWKVYSLKHRQWHRAVVGEIRDDDIVLRPEGTLDDLLTVDREELLTNFHRYHLAGE